MSEENKGVVRAMFDCWNSGELGRIDDLVAADAVVHDPYDPHGSEGAEGLKKTIAMYRSAFPDLEFRIDDMLADGDKVVLRWEGAGTHEGEVMGIAGTGKRSTVTGIGIFRLENGKVAESWTNWDTLGMLTQIGAIPQRAGATA